MTRRYYAVLAKVSLSYPPLLGRLVTCYSPVRHFTHGLLHFLVRLACVRHAASVDSEPGSNSRLKPSLSSYPTEVGSFDYARASLRRAYYLPCEKIKPNLIVSHDWHVQPYCQRSLRAVRLSGAPFGSRPGLLRQGVLELIAHCPILLSSSCRHFCANLLNLSKFRSRVKLRFRWNQDHNFTSTASRFSCLFDRHNGQSFWPQKVALRKISNINQRLNRLAHFARTRGLASWVMQWVCSLRDSLQGLWCA